MVLRNLLKTIKDKYIDKDKKYIIAANTVTIRRFGPSRSLKKKNIVREQRRDVRARIRRVFFEGRDMGEVYRRN